MMEYFHIDNEIVREFRDWSYAFKPKNYGDAKNHPMCTQYSSPMAAMRKYAREKGKAVGIRADGRVVIVWNDYGKIRQKTYKEHEVKVTWENKK